MSEKGARCSTTIKSTEPVIRSRIPARVRYAISPLGPLSGARHTDPTERHKCSRGDGYPRRKAPRSERQDFLRVPSTATPDITRFRRAENNRSTLCRKLPVADASSPTPRHPGEVMKWDHVLSGSLLDFVAFPDSKHQDLGTTLRHHLQSTSQSFPAFPFGFDSSLVALSAAR